MDERLTIGDLAKATGTKVVTVRYYEQAGLLPAPPRTSGNYRAYGAGHLNRLRFIRRCRDLGFTLDQVGDLLRLSTQENQPCAEVNRISAEHLTEIEQKFADLTRLADELRRSIIFRRIYRGECTVQKPRSTSGSRPAIGLKRAGGLANLFKLMISPAARRKQFERQQETQKQALRQRQAQSRNERAATLKASRRVELAKLSQEFQTNREAMKARHASEVAAQKMVWRQLAAKREKVWSDYRQEFALKEAEQENAVQQQSHRDEFREAASGTTRAEAKPEHERKADQNQGNGADRTPTTEKSTRRDWRARRSAAERKSDGTYKKRDRGNDDGGRSRERDRHEPD